VKPQDIQQLTKGEDAWGVPELVQAVTILVTFHSLAAFASGLGITLELDRRGDVTYKMTPILLTPSAEEIEPDPQGAKNNEELISRMRQFTDRSDTESVSSVSSNNAEVTQKLFEESEISWKPKTVQKNSERRKNINDFSHFHGGVEVAHEDYNVKSTEYKTFRLQEFSWEDQGFSLINRYYPGTGELLDELFTETFNLTDSVIFDSTNVDTSPFRQAVWYYVLRLKGMIHDDYEYSQVNACLNVTLKKYIKKVACYPELVTKGEYANMGVNLFDYEKAHINYLIMESRAQAELLYVFSALRRT